jgi:hypothetical protein
MMVNDELSVFGKRWIGRLTIGNDYDQNYKSHGDRCKGYQSISSQGNN